ncbi:MAG: hypothetical protein K0U84_13445 [Actinomycetia bacterium]|nr:hypothetical protein [Actinomycetes bacterium]
MTTRNLSVGDVLRCSWGYEQTNVDFYEVTRLAGKLSADLRPIAQTRESTGDMTGYASPEPGNYTGPAFRRRVNDDSVRISSYSFARKCAPDERAYWSSYG